MCGKLKTDRQTDRQTDRSTRAHSVEDVTEGSELKWQAGERLLDCMVEGVHQLHEVGLVGLELAEVRQTSRVHLVVQVT